MSKTIVYASNHWRNLTDLNSILKISVPIGKTKIVLGIRKS